MITTHLIAPFKKSYQDQHKCTKTSPRYKKSQALKDLEKLSLEAKRLRYPNNPYLLGESFEDKTANGLTKAIIAYIKLTGGFAERCSNTGRVIDSSLTFTDVLGHTRTIGSVKWIPGSGTNGTADIASTFAGKSIKIEVKIGSDKQSQAQINYQRAVESAGAIYYIAKDFESFKTWYDQISKV